MRNLIYLFAIVAFFGCFNSKNVVQEPDSGPAHDAPTVVNGTTVDSVLFAVYNGQEEQETVVEGDDIEVYTEPTDSVLNDLGMGIFLVGQDWREETPDAGADTCNCTTTKYLPGKVVVKTEYKTQTVTQVKRDTVFVDREVVTPQKIGAKAENGVDWIFVILSAVVAGLGTWLAARRKTT
jgi:protein involved in temperature-dependent protein secretion